MTEKKSDLFKRRKGVHIQLNTDTHAYLRRELFTAGMTMQELFEEFAQLVASGDHRAKKMMDSFITARIKREIKALEMGTSKKGPLKVDELNSEKLYNLISEADVLEHSHEDSDGEERA